MALRHTVPWCSLASKKRGGFELNITDSNDVGPLKSVLTKLGSRLKIAALKSASPKVAPRKFEVKLKIAPGKLTFPKLARGNSADPNSTSLKRAAVKLTLGKLAEEKFAPSKSAHLEPVSYTHLTLPTTERV